MKAYIQDLCGDENPVDIDCAVLQCMLQDAIFEKLSAEEQAVVDENYKNLHRMIREESDENE